MVDVRPRSAAERRTVRRQARTEAGRVRARRRLVLVPDRRARAPQIAAICGARAGDPGRWR